MFIFRFSPVSLPLVKEGRALMQLQYNKADIRWSSSKMDFEDRCCTGKQSQGFFQLQDIDRFTCVKQWGQLVVNCLNHRETPPMKKWKHSLFCISKFLDMLCFEFLTPHTGLDLLRLCESCHLLM
ncbi:unnamed protein product [Lepidochelys olivacea]